MIKPHSTRVNVMCVMKLPHSQDVAQHLLSIRRNRMHLSCAPLSTVRSPIIGTFENAPQTVKLRAGLESLNAVMLLGLVSLTI